jgi:DNA-binding NarL/FixJ family response regulator
VALRPREPESAARSSPRQRRAAVDPRAASQLRLIVADGSPATRAGLRALLEEEGFEVCGDASNGASAVDMAVRERPDVCLIENSMAAEGMGAIEQIVELVPESAIIVLTVAGDEPNAIRALRAGAVGCVLTSADAEALAVAIRAVARGEAVLPRPILTKLIEGIGERERRIRLFAQLPLTSREAEVLDLLREGNTTAAIASRLFISQVTVRTHICSIFKKLDVHDRQAAVRFLAGAELDPLLPPQ